MNFFRGLLLFCLVSAAVASRHKGKGHEAASRSHPLVFSRRSASNNSGILHCDCVCTGKSNNSDSSWEIDISGLISLAYQKTQNVIAVYSRDNQLGIAVDGNSGILLFFNVSAGGALVVNVTQGYARLLTGSTQISNLFRQSTHLADAIPILAQIITNNSANLTVATGNVFDLSAVLRLLRSGNSDVRSLFAGRLDLYKQLVANFGASLNYLLVYYRTVKISVKYNAVELIAAVTYRFPSLQIALVRLVNSLYVSLGGKFNAAFAFEIYTELSSASAILSGDLFVALSNALQGVGSLFLDLTAAVKAVSDGIRFDNITSVVTKIGGTSGVIVSASYNYSWLLDIRGSLNNSFSFVLGYNESVKTLGFYNRKQNLTAVFVGGADLIGIFNVTSGGGLLINVTRGIAKVITSTSIDFRILIINSASFIEGIGVLGQVTLQYAGQINGSVNTLLNSQDVFDLNPVLAAITKPGFNLGFLFLLRLSLYEKLQANFGAFFVSVNQGFLNGGISSSLGVFGFFAYISGDLVGFSNSLVQLVFELYIKGISFQANVLLVIYEAITVHIEEFISGRLLLGISVSIGKLGSVYVDIIAAVKGGIAAAFSVFTNLTTGVVTIGGKIINIEYGFLEGGSWVITLLASNKSVLNIGVVYDSTLNVLGVFNRNLNVGVIFNGNSGIYAIFNATAGSGLVVNATSGIALLVTGLGDYTYLFAESINIYEGIVIYSTLLFKNLDINLSNENAFDLQAVLVAIRDNVDWAILLKYRLDLHERLQASFGALFVLIGSNIQSGIIDVSQGVISITVLIFGNLQAVSKGFLQLFIALYIRVGGTFNSRLSLVIFQELVLNSNVVIQGSIFESLTVLVNKIGVVYSSIDQALSSIIDNRIFTNISSGLIEFGKINVTASLGLATDGSWLVNLIGQVNSSLNVVVGYNRSINVFGVLNRRDKLAAVINGDFGLLAIFNLSSSAGLVVNASSGIALLVNASAELSGSIEVFSILNEVLIEHSSHVCLSSNNAFNLTTLVIAIENKTDLAAVFAGKAELYGRILLEFGGTLTAISKLLLSGVITVKQGGVVAVAVIFGELTVISQNIIKLLVNLYQNVQIKGKFGVELALQIFISFRQQLGKSVTIFLQSLISIVKSVGVLTDSLSGAISSYLTVGVIPTIRGIISFDNTTANVTYGVLLEGSWIISVRSLIDLSLNLDLVYNKTLNLFGVYNRQFNFSVIFNGNNGIFGLYNVTAGSAILVNVTSGLGKFITLEADLSYLFETSAVFGVSVLGRLLVDEIAGLGASVNLDAAIFDLKALIIALNGNANLSVIFKEHAELYAEVIYSFGVYFSIVASRLRSTVISINLGVLALVQASLSLNAKLAITVVDLLNALYLRVHGVFDAEVFLVFYLRFVKSVGGSFETKLLEVLTNAVLAIGSVYGNLVGALNSLVNVTVDVKHGIISVGGISLNITSGLSLAGSWLVELGGKLDIIDFGIAYNKSLNVIGFYNYKLDLTVIFSGSTGIIGVFNASSGAGLLINGTNNVGKFIAGSADVTYLFRISVLQGVSVLGSLVANTSLNVNITQNLRAYFDVSVLLKALQNQVIDLTTVFKNQAELAAILQLQFSGLLSIIRQRFTQEIISIKTGVVVFLSGVLDFSVEIIARGLLDVFAALNAKVHLLFDVTFALQIWYELTLNTIRTALFETLIAVIHGVGTIYGNLLDAINAIASLSWLRTLTTDILHVGNFSGNLSKAISGDGTWLVEIVGAIDTNAKVKINVLYDYHLNVLGIYNAALGLVAVFDGTLAKFGFFNITTGNGLLVDYFKGEAWFISSSSISYLFTSQTEVVLGISQVGKILQQTATSVENRLNFTQVITLLSQKQDWKIAVQGSVELRENLDVSFGGFFAHLSVRLQANFKVNFGVINALWVFFEIEALAQGFVQLIAAIYSNLKGLFTVALLAVVYAQFVVNVVGIFFETLINAILSIVFPILGGIEFAVTLILRILGILVGGSVGISASANVSASERNSRHQLQHVRNTHEHLRLTGDTKAASNLAYRAQFHEGIKNRKHQIDRHSNEEHKSRSA